MSRYKKNTISRNRIIKFQQFIDIAERKLLGCKNTDKVFSVVVMEFKLKDNSISHQIPAFIEYILATISENIGDDDLYTVDEKNRFILFLDETRENLTILTTSKIVNEIKQSLINYIELDIGVSIHPQDGMTINELIQDSINSIARSNEKIKKIITANNTSFKQLKERLNNIDNTTRSGRIIEQINILIEHICNYDVYLGEHSCLVTAGSIIFARELGLSWKEIERIAVASILHDVGYTAFPRNIFTKAGELTANEWKMIKLHIAVGCEQILRPLKLFDDYITIIQDHHEFMDGSGYPRRKKGDQIPLGSKIISMVDTYQALRADRPYRKAFVFEDIVDVYLANAGIKWDKELVTVFLAIIGDPTIRERMADKNIGFEILPFD